jgi:CubicO group peptidase (beta-lactamase class C family)
VDEASLAGLLRDHVSAQSVPGAAIGIVREGSVATACFGTADVTTGEPVTPATRFTPGSLTKPMVATVVVRLAQAGRLALDDPIEVHVPEVRGCGWAERATLRDLLVNRSGLPMSADLEFGFERRQASDDDALARLAADVAGVSPASAAWSYSNAGWCLLGRAIETATGGTWEDAMRRELFEPAGMSDAAFSIGTGDVPRAGGHEMTADGPAPVPPLISRAYGPAGISLVATLTDLLRFAALHLEDPALAAMREVHSDVSIHAWFDAWCLGWGRFDWGDSVWGWDGLVPGERSVLRLLPERRAAVALVTNSGTGRALYRSLFADLMPQAFGIAVPPLRLAPSPGAAGDLSRYGGVYAWPDRRVDVTATDEGLRIVTGEETTEALPIDDRTFLLDAADADTPTVTFGAFDASGRPMVFYDMLWGLPRADA